MKNKKKKIQISAAVASAISNMLFDSEGIDMSPVINALSANETRDKIGTYTRAKGTQMH